MNSHSPQHSGFALIELLVYLGVLVMTLLVVVTAITSFGRVYARIDASQALARSGASALERIVRDVRNAQSIVQASSSFGAHPGRLTLAIPVSAGTTTTTAFSVATTTIQLTENGVVTGAITNDDVVVENLSFYRIATAHSEGVRIVLTLSKNVGTSTISATFYDTAVLRGSYAL